ncbi:MAG: LUD domain-containing protein [Candidatus Hodarchaeales archaeon]
MNLSSRLILERVIKNYESKRAKILDESELDEIKKRIREIREFSIDNQVSLWIKAEKNLSSNGVGIYHAKNSEEARNIFIELIKNCEIIVKSKSNLIEELDLDFGKATVVETDLGEWVVKNMKVEKAHPVTPAIFLSIEQITEFLSTKGYSFAQVEEMVKGISEIIKQKIFVADAGLTGANLVTAEGQIVLIENEGNISLISRIPKRHIVFAGIDKIAPSIEDAAFLAKVMSVFGTGEPASYINFISGPSKTSDIEQKSIRGVSGAEEVHLIIVDNGRSKLLEDRKLRESLYCIGCGACLFYCPVYRQVGSGFGVNRLGGNSLVHRGFSKSPEGLDRKGLFDCTGCELCEEICPTGLKMWDNLKKLRGKVAHKKNEMMKKQILRKGNAVEGSTVWGGKK